MFRGKLFLLLFVGGLIVVQIPQQFLWLAPDPFENADHERLKRMRDLMTVHQASYKVRHLENATPYDIMLFGSSCILSIGEDEIRHPGRVFNAAVPGSSIRSSLAIAEHARSIGKLAPINIFMIMNFNQFTQQLAHLPLRLRWLNTIDDVQRGFLDPNISNREMLQMIFRHVRQEAELFVQFFNIRALRSSLSVRFPNWFSYDGSSSDLVWGQFDSDGSGGDLTAAKPGRVGIVPRPSQSGVLPGYFKNDLRRLAALAKGRNVVVYESPLEPANMAAMDATPSVLVETLRKTFLQQCRQLNLRCVSAPLLGTPGEPNLWTDHFHPPSRVLAPFINSLIDALQADLKARGDK